MKIKERFYLMEKSFQVNFETWVICNFLHENRNFIWLKNLVRWILIFKALIIFYTQFYQLKNCQLALLLFVSITKISKNMTIQYKMANISMLTHFHVHSSSMIRSTWNELNSLVHHLIKNQDHPVVCFKLFHYRNEVISPSNRVLLFFSFSFSLISFVVYCFSRPIYLQFNFFTFLELINVDYC